MDDLSIFNAYASGIAIEVLLYENFDEEPQWKQVRIKEMPFGPNGIERLELMILKDGWPTPWSAMIAREKFATDLREKTKS